VKSLRVFLELYLALGEEEAFVRQCLNAEEILGRELVDPLEFGLEQAYKTHKDDRSPWFDKLNPRLPAISGANLPIVLKLCGLCLTLKAPHRIRTAPGRSRPPETPEPPFDKRISALSLTLLSRVSLIVGHLLTPGLKLDTFSHTLPKVIVRAVGTEQQAVEEVLAQSGVDVSQMNTPHRPPEALDQQPYREWNDGDFDDDVD